MISYQPDATNPLNPANRDVLPRQERIAAYPCDWVGCPNDAHAPGALCDACQAEADAAAPDDQPTPPTTMNTNDNFDELWANLKEQVRAARTKRTTIETRSDLTYMERMIFGGHVRVTGGDIDGGYVHLSRGNWNGGVSVNADDLRTIAAHCLAAAEEIEAAKSEADAVRPEPATAAS